MSEPKKQNILRSFTAQGLAGLLFVIGACLMILRPPVTWSEIFYLASLKSTGVTIALSDTAHRTQAGQQILTLQKPPYAPEWFNSLVRSLSDFIQAISSSAWSSDIGRTEMIAHRLVCLALATMVYFLRSPKIARNLRMTHRRVFPFQNALFAAILLLLVRWGAAEQLYVLIALSALTQTSSATEIDAYDRKKTFAWLTICACALALASSRTWIYSIVPAAFFWILLQPIKWQFFKQALFTILVTTVAALGLFLIHGSYETLVGFLTQRWLYLNEPRYVSVVWSGAVLPWKILCAWLGLINLHRMANAIGTGSLATRNSFAQLLAISSAVHLCYYQKTPTAADVLVLALLSVHHIGNQNRQTKTLFLRLTQKLFWIFGAILVCALIAAFVLLLLPSSRAVPDLAATMQGLDHLRKNFPILCLSAFALALAGIYFRLIAMRSKRSGRRMAAARYDHLTACTAVAYLFCSSELRSHFLWHPLKSSIESLSPQTQIFYLPKLEPLIRLLPQTPNRTRMAAIYQGESVTNEAQRSMLLVPREISDLCTSAGWNVERSSGIFALCDLGHGAISHLLPIN